MKTTWPRFLKPLATVSLVAVLGLVAFQFRAAPDPERRLGTMHVDAQRNPLVVFVLIDTLRRDHVGTLGYDRPTTPNLDRLANDAENFGGMMTEIRVAAAAP